MPFDPDRRMHPPKFVIEVERSQAMADHNIEYNQRGVTAERRIAVEVPANDGPSLRFTYGAARGQDGEFIAGAPTVQQEGDAYVFAGQTWSTLHIVYVP